MPPKKSETNQQLGAALRELRGQAGFSQEGFASAAGLDRSYYGAIERGEFNLTVDTLAKIADGLGTKISALFAAADL